MRFLCGRRHARAQRTPLSDEQLAGIVFRAAIIITIWLIGLTVFAIAVVLERNFPTIKLQPYQHPAAQQSSLVGVPA